MTFIGKKDILNPSPRNLYLGHQHQYSSEKGARGRLGRGRHRSVCAGAWSLVTQGHFLEGGRMFEDLALLVVRGARGASSHKASVEAKGQASVGQSASFPATGTAPCERHNLRKLLGNHLPEL